MLANMKDAARVAVVAGWIAATGSCSVGSEAAGEDPVAAFKQNECPQTEAFGINFWALLLTETTTTCSQQEATWGLASIDGLMVDSDDVVAIAKGTDLAPFFKEAWASPWSTVPGLVEVLTEDGVEPLVPLTGFNLGQASYAVVEVRGQRIPALYQTQSGGTTYSNCYYTMQANGCEYCCTAHYAAGGSGRECFAYGPTCP